MTETTNERRCRECGCTEETACDSNGRPCRWVEVDLCSSCVDEYEGTGNACVWVDGSLVDPPGFFVRILLRDFAAESSSHIVELASRLDGLGAPVWKNLELDADAEERMLVGLYLAEKLTEFIEFEPKTTSQEAFKAAIEDIEELKRQRSRPVMYDWEKLQEENREALARSLADTMRNTLAEHMPPRAAEWMRDNDVQVAHVQRAGPCVFAFLRPQELAHLPRSAHTWIIPDYPARDEDQSQANAVYEWASDSLCGLEESDLEVEVAYNRATQRTELVLAPISLIEYAWGQDWPAHYRLPGTYFHEKKGRDIETSDPEWRQDEYATVTGHFIRCKAEIGWVPAELLAAEKSA